MKKINILLILVAGLIVNLNAQITMTYKSHALMVGDSHDFIIAQNVDEGPAGSGVIWDFSELTPANKTLTSHMLNAASTEKGSSISSANTVIEEYGNMFYFNVKKDIIEQYGTVSGSAVTKYDKPFVKIKYPFTYGSHVFGDYSGVQQSANANYKVSGTYTIDGDAYGTLILPGNITLDNVLRVKQTRTFESGNTSEITYRWYAADVRYPVLVIIKYISNNQTYISQTAYYAHASNKTKSATNIDAFSQNVTGIEVSPNPFDNNLKVAYTLNAKAKIQIDMYDASGRLVKNIQSSATQNAGPYSISIEKDENAFKPGIYYLRITSGKNAYTKKVIKR